MNEIEKTGHLVLYSKFKPNFNLSESNYTSLIEGTLTNLTYIESANIDYFDYSGDELVVAYCESGFPWWLIILPAVALLGSCKSKSKEWKQ